MKSETMKAKFEKWYAESDNMDNVDHIDVIEVAAGCYRLHVYYKEPIKVPSGQLIADSVFGPCGEDCERFLPYPQ